MACTLFIDRKCVEAQIDDAKSICRMLTHIITEQAGAGVAIRVTVETDRGEHYTAVMGGRITISFGSLLHRG